MISNFIPFQGLKNYTDLHTFLNLHRGFVLVLVFDVHYNWGQWLNPPCIYTGPHPTVHSRPRTESPADMEENLTLVLLALQLQWEVNNDPGQQSFLFTQQTVQYNRCSSFHKHQIVLFFLSCNPDYNYITTYPAIWFYAPPKDFICDVLCFSWNTQYIVLHYTY